MNSSCLRNRRLSLQLFEERCTPATVSYAPESQTLTVFASENDEIHVWPEPGGPAGYLIVEEEDGTDFFVSSDDHFAVTNLIFRCEQRNNVWVHIGLDVNLSGKLEVFGPKLAHELVVAGTINGDVSFNATNNCPDYVYFHEDSFVGGDVTVHLGAGVNDLTLWGTIGGAATVTGGLSIFGGSNEISLPGGAIGGNLSIVTGKGDDTIKLVQIGDVSIGGSAIIELGTGLNRIDGKGPQLLAIDGNLNYMGGAGQEILSFQTGNASLSVGGDMKVDLGSAPAAMGDLVGFGSVAVAGKVKITGSAPTSIVRFYENLSAFGDVNVALSGVNNLLGFSGFGVIDSTIGGHLNYVGGPGKDQVSLDALTVAKNATIVLGENVGGTQHLVVGNNDAAGVHIQGHLKVTSGQGEELLSLRRLSVGKTLKIFTGAGDDHVSMNDVAIAGLAVVDLGAGNDALTLDLLKLDTVGDLTGEVRFGGRLIVRAGAGDDRLRFSDSGVANTHCRFERRVVLNGGLGVDEFSHANCNYQVSNNFEDFEFGGPLP